ncbi:MAG: NADH-quinone oxidoreductase subunit NuoG [Gammaproteobacteria bacterium]|nr:NADH-quinone oxidoreductase subunit NuoG [Gammaproteobacteria bacterium]
MVNIEINGKVIETRDGVTLIEAADSAGITIPRFCYHSKLSIAASCRMCLVEVEKAPKPLPACATPVSEGMKVHTRSPKAIAAQRSVMEFLLINHPLDCPICDQGGECDLQEMAMGYGSGISRYTEGKRVVHNPDLGALIATDMTRCIHCTRCVRFGQEVAGMMELGAPGRGEHMHIGTYMEGTVDSELSGNVIDLCPVGALTSKPYRYTARPWELRSYHSISPHDCVGSNIRVDVRNGKAMRVVPRENETVNETWIADRDRYSYTANDHPERLTQPMIREEGEWIASDWDTALTRAAEGLKAIAERDGAEQLGALASYSATTEEFYLLQKLMRGIGSGNIDHRLRQVDFRDQAEQPAYPALGQAIQDLELLDAVLLIGSNIRKDQPLLAQRLRKASRNNGAQIMAINAVDYDFTFPLAQKCITTDLGAELSGVLKALLTLTGDSAPDSLQPLLTGVEPSEAQQNIAETLKAAPQATVLLGNTAASYPARAELQALANLIAELAGARVGLLAEGGNSAGAWLAGCLPHREAGGRAATVSGMDWRAMVKAGLKGYLLLGIEPELDCIESAAVTKAMEQAEFVVALTAYTGEGLMAQADVLLPIGTFLETAGSFINTEGHWQSFGGVARAAGESRPAWKVLRVLGNLLDLNGFAYTSAETIRTEMEGLFGDVPIGNRSEWTMSEPTKLHQGLLRIADVPIYAVDPMVRRAMPLQATADALLAVRLSANSRTLEKYGLADGDQATVSQDGGEATFIVAVDERLPDNAVYLPAGISETRGLGGSFSPIQLAKA